MQPIRVSNWLSLALAAEIAAACSGASDTQRDARLPDASTEAPVPVAAARLDVPRLVGLSIDELEQQLGARSRVPDTILDPTLALGKQGLERLDSTALFRWRGMPIIAAYDDNTRQVSDLLLLGANEDELMRRGQLQSGAQHYLVLPVFEPRRPTVLMGLRVLATSPINRTLVKALRPSPYRPSGGSAKGTKADTSPPKR